MPSGRSGKTILKIAKLRNGKMLLSLEGGEKLLLSADLFTEFFLYEGKELSAEDYRKIQKSLQSDALYAYGKRLLARGRYSEALLRKKLYEKDPEHAYRAFIRLKNEGFFDDRELALDYMEMKLAQGYGRKRIEEDLLHKKLVPASIVDGLPFPRGDAMALLPTLEKRFASKPLARKKELAERYLRYRGFSGTEIAPVLASLKAPPKSVSSENLERDFLALYRRYEKRYNGRELRERLFAALLRKGYASEDVRNLLKEKIDESY